MVFFLLAVGIFLIRAGILDGWNILTIGLGVAFAGGSVLGTPRLRIFVKVVINRVSGKHVFEIEQSNISNSNVIGTARDVHIYEAPRMEQEREVPPSGLIDWIVDSEFSLSPDAYRSFPINLKDEEHLVGYVEADGTVSCYVLGRLSLKSFEDQENFNPYWAEEGVTKTKVSFIAEGGRAYFFVVEYAEEDYDDEDEDISVSVKLRVQS